MYEVGTILRTRKESLKNVGWMKYFKNTRGFKFLITATNFIFCRLQLALACKCAEIKLAGEIIYRFW
jgi:hypothetical protein